MTDRPNYGYLILDEECGLPYITDLATGKKLYKLPNCEICGIGTYSFTASATGRCAHCATPERNDNVEAA